MARAMGGYDDCHELGKKVRRDIMDRRTEQNWKKQLDFAYAQVDYWKNMAFANKEELEYYKGIVEEAVAKGTILLVDEDGNDLMLFDDEEEEENED